MYEARKTFPTTVTTRELARIMIMIIKYIKCIILRYCAPGYTYTYIYNTMTDIVIYCFRYIYVYYTLSPFGFLVLHVFVFFFRW